MIPVLRRSSGETIILANIYHSKIGIVDLYLNAMATGLK